jgi:Protein of unknown function (DUF3293)
MRKLAAAAGASSSAYYSSQKLLLLAAWSSAVVPIPYSRAAMMSSSSTTDTSSIRTKQLQDLWSTSFDAWINVPHHDEPIVYLRPAQQEPPDNNNSGNSNSNHHHHPTSSCHRLPAIVQQVSMFAITGYNPMGEDRPIGINRVANEQLRHDLEQLSNPRPHYIWPAFGFAQHWREDGFVVAYDPADRSAGEAAVVALAIEYQQGAIFGFDAIYVENTTTATGMERVGSLLRRTIPAAMRNVEADVVVVACEKPAGMSNADHPLPPPPPPLLVSAERDKTTTSE